MNDYEVIKQLVGLFDTTIALGIAVWIINIGVNRLDKIQLQYQGFVEKVLGQQQENNNELMSLVSNLCIQTAPPKVMRRGATKEGL